MFTNQIQPVYFDWSRAQIQHRDCLPHLRQDNVIYFITFRLLDSVPQSKLDKLRQRKEIWLSLNPFPHSEAQSAEFKKIWTAPIEKMLDNGHGNCELRLPECRQRLQATFHHDDRLMYSLGNYIIMPNHAHVLVHVLPGSSLSSILEAWKSISARQINRLLKRHGSLWQAESFDHIVRDASHLKKFVNYIQKNPTHLPPGTFSLSHGSLSVASP